MKKTILSVAIVTLLSLSVSGCLSTGGSKASEKVDYTPLTINHFDILERPKKNGLVLDVQKFKSIDHKNWEYYVNLVNTYSYEDLKDATKNHHRQIFETYRANAEIMGDFGLSTHDQRMGFREKQEKLLKINRYNSGENVISSIMSGGLTSHYDLRTKASTLAALAILYNASLDGAGIRDREAKVAFSVNPVRSWNGLCELMFREPGNTYNSVNDAQKRIIMNSDSLGRATDSINRFTSTLLGSNIGTGSPTSIRDWVPLDPVYLSIISGRKNGHAVIDESSRSDDVNSCVIRKKDIIYESWRVDAKGRDGKGLNVKDPEKSEKIMEVLTRQHYKDYAKYSACSVGFCGEETQGYKFVN